MTRRALFGVLAAPLLPATEAVIPPGLECAHCAERPDGAEGTIWCAECLAWYRNNYTLEWIREQPSAGDSIRCRITGNRVTVDRVVDGAGVVFYTLTRPNGENKKRGAWIAHWRTNPAWATAEVASGRRAQAVGNGEEIGGMGRMETDPVIEDFAYDEEEGTCHDCGAAADEECEADCPSWDEDY